MYSNGPPHRAKQKQDDQLEHTYSSHVRIRDVALKTCQRRWMIGRSGERGSGISVLAARHDDDDDDIMDILMLIFVLEEWEVDTLTFNQPKPFKLFTSFQETIKNPLLNIGCLSIHGTHVTANNSTNNNVVFFFVSDLKTVYYNNYRVSQYTWDPCDC